MRPASSHVYTLVTEGDSDNTLSFCVGLPWFNTPVLLSSLLCSSCFDVTDAHPIRAISLHVCKPSGCRHVVVIHVIVHAINIMQ